MDDTSERAIALLEELLETEVSADDVLAELDVDSLTLLEWVFAIEQEFDLVLDDVAVEHVDKSQTVAAVAALLVAA
jgi:acyl carrier protein